MVVIHDAVGWRVSLANKRRDPAGTRAAGARLRADAGQDRLKVARALIVDGAGAWAGGDYEDALHLLHAAIDVLDELDPGGTSHLDERGAASVELGTATYHLGDHASALDHLGRALVLESRRPDPARRAEALNRIGTILMHRGELHDARRAFAECVEIRERIGPPVEVAGARNNLAKVHIELGELTTALMLLTAATRTWEDEDEPRGVAMTLTNVAIVHQRAGRGELALAYFEANLSLRVDLRDAYGECEGRRLLGGLHLEEGRVDQAIAELLAAHRIAEGVGARDELARTAEALADAYEAAGEATTALDWHRRFHRIERQVYDESSALRLRHLQVAYQVDRAERESTTDALTGLPNRRLWDRRLAEALSDPDATPLAVLLFDLDRFKAVNDDHSHAIGDEVLVAIGTLLDHVLDDHTVRARHGGEEFAVLLVDHDLDAATAVAHRITDAVRYHPWGAIAPGLDLTISIGVATVHDPTGIDPATLMRRADVKLYEAKDAGRDRVAY